EPIARRSGGPAPTVLSGRTRRGRRRTGADPPPRRGRHGRASTQPAARRLAGVEVVAGQILHVVPAGAVAAERRRPGGHRTPPTAAPQLCTRLSLNGSARLSGSRSPSLRPPSTGRTRRRRRRAPAPGAGCR